MGDTNVVVGTDYPADMADGNIAETLAAIGLSEESRSRIEHENAERLFGAVVPSTL
jgi:predicted TIM-barrel fold metal-dependent hydrolase